MANEETMESDIPVVNDPKYGTLANFKIDKKIGKGQFSEVWRASCTVDECVVALKKVQVKHIVEVQGWLLGFETK